MYSVSDKYKKALLGNVVTDRISGKITLADGTKIALSDENLVKNSLKITHELCGDYKIGTFNLGCLQIAIFDDGALMRDFSGALICPVYEIQTGENWEKIPMGVYIADGGSVRRKRDTVSMTAYDSGIMFDRVIPDDKRGFYKTAPYYINMACEDCGVELDSIEEELPNSEEKIQAYSSQIHTYRDLVAWCAALMCGYAVIDRSGKLRIISAKYGVQADDASDIVIDKYLTEEERDSIYVTDTRAYIKTLNAYCAGQPKTYVSDYVSDDEQAAPAVYCLPNNPLLMDRTEEVCDRVNESWLAYIDGFKQRGITAVIYGDPALDVGDTLRCSGGDVDQRGSIVGVVTKQEWRYRKFHSIVCAAAQVSPFSPSVEAAETTGQLEKKIVSYAAGAGIDIEKNTISLKPAKYSSAYVKPGESRLGGVMVYGDSLSVDENGVLGLRYATKSSVGGVAPYNGLHVDPHGQLNVYPGKGLHFDLFGKTDKFCGEPVAVNLGPGMKFADDPEDVSTVDKKQVVVPDLGTGLFLESYENEEGTTAYRIAANLGQNLEIDENGKINAKDGLTAGNGVDIQNNVINVKVDGNTVKFNENKELTAEGGSTLTAGDGVDIQKDIISVKVDGSTVKFNENKELTAASGVVIDKAVIIKEAEAKHILHNFTQVEYLAGNKIGYAGPGNPIIVGGYVFYKNQSDIIALGSAPYTSVTFAKAGIYSNQMVENCDLYMRIIEVASDRAKVVAASQALNMNTTTINGTFTFDLSKGGLGFIWNTIYSPSNAHPNGYIYGSLKLCYINSSKIFTVENALSSLYVDFGSMAEYEAAVGLTYEPLTLTRVEDNPTIV